MLHFARNKLSPVCLANRIIWRNHFTLGDSKFAHYAHRVPLDENDAELRIRKKRGTQRQKEKGKKMGKIGKHAFLKAFYIRCNNNKLSEREEKNQHTHTLSQK